MIPLQTLSGAPGGIGLRRTGRHPTSGNAGQRNGSAPHAAQLLVAGERATRAGKRVLFLTYQGYIGIAAADVGARDVVCLLSGSKVPFNLRPLNGQAVMERTQVSIMGCFDYDYGAAECDEKYRAVISQLRDGSSSSSYNTFRLMGDAYVNGIMKCQGVAKCAQGPLKILPTA